MSNEPARIRPRTLAALQCALALVLAAAPLAAAEKAAKADAPKADPAQDAAMAEMMKYAAPGPGHEVLKSMVGTWEASVKMLGGPGEPTVTPGTSENRLVLGGRYLEQRFTSTLFDQPFEGWGLMGFDNRRGVYTNVWVDNSSTEVLTGDGSWDAATKTMTASMKGTGPDGKVMTMRNVTRVVDADTHVFSMFSDMGGKEQLMMEITYKRKR
jgi:hypothetical protein